MNVAQQVKLGIQSYEKAHQLIVKHKMWGYVLLPGIINLALFIISGILAWQYSTEFTSIIINYVPWINELNANANWIKTTIQIIILIVIRILFLLAYLYTYKYIVLILMTPILPIISEKAEANLTGSDFPFNTKQFIKDIIRGLVLATKNGVKELLLLAILFFLSFLPIIGLASPVIIFIVQAYFTGFSMLDYYQERHQVSVKESKQFIYQNKWLSIINGSGFIGLSLVPIIGQLIAPSYSVIAATIAMQQLNKR